MKPNIGIGDEQRQAVVGILNTLLAEKTPRTHGVRRTSAVNGGERADASRRPLDRRVRRPY
jgi:hypothetical protein